MKITFTAMTGTILLAMFAGTGASSAFTMTKYTNAVLNGCYGNLSTSVDTAVETNRASVGTLCFDGAGNIVEFSGSDQASGHCVDTNGFDSCGAVKGKYAILNSPGQGMGTFNLTGKCNTFYTLSVNSVDSQGLAHGFQFVWRSSTCNKGPNVVQGTGWLQ